MLWAWFLGSILSIRYPTLIQPDLILAKLWPSYHPGSICLFNSPTNDQYRFPLSVTRVTISPLRNDSWSNNDCASSREFRSAVRSQVGGLLFDIMCKLNFFLLEPFQFYAFLAWNGTFFLFHYKTAVNECFCCTPQSAILIWDKSQSSTLENSISLMRYEYGSEQKSEIVCCFQTNPLKVIWSSAANYRALWAASCLQQTPPSPFPTFPPTTPLSVHHIPSLCFIFRISALLLRCLELTGRLCGPVMWGQRDLSASYYLSLCWFRFGISPRQVAGYRSRVWRAVHCRERNRRWQSKVRQLTKSE